MKRATVLLAVLLVLSTAILPHPAAAGGWRGGHHGHGGAVWWPAALVGGLALGAVALATAPLWAFAPPPPAPDPIVAAPVVYAAPPPAPVPAVSREVVYPHGRYVLYGDGVRQPWQWVWVPAAPPASSAPPPR